MKNFGPQISGCLAKPPPTLGEPNPYLPCARTDVKIKYNPDKGRYLVAEKDIGPGEMLLVEAVSTLRIWSAGSAPHQLALVQQDVQELGKGETPGGVSDRDNVGYQLAASAVLPHHQLLILLPNNGRLQLLHM